MENIIYLRCYIEKEAENLWVACCLDFCLAAQAESHAEVQKKLNRMIRDHLDFIKIEEDRSFACQLYTRRAPWPDWVKYYFYSFLDKININKNSNKYHLILKERFSI